MVASWPSRSWRLEEDELSLGRGISRLGQTHRGDCDAIDVVADIQTLELQHRPDEQACADLKKACDLKECEGIEWALENGVCKSG